MDNTFHSETSFNDHDFSQSSTATSDENNRESASELDESIVIFPLRASRRRMIVSSDESSDSSFSEKSDSSRNDSFSHSSPESDEKIIDDEALVEGIVSSDESVSEDSYENSFIDDMTPASSEIIKNPYLELSHKLDRSPIKQYSIPKEAVISDPESSNSEEDQYESSFICDDTQEIEREMIESPAKSSVSPIYDTSSRLRARNNRFEAKFAALRILRQQKQARKLL